MNRILFTYRGIFQCWLYTASHGQLLFRSTKSVDRPTQVDVLFTNVTSVSFHTVMEDFELTETDVDPENRVRNSKVPVRFFLLRSRGHDGFVVAGSVTNNEGDHEYHEPSPLLSSI